MNIDIDTSIIYTMIHIPAKYFNHSLRGVSENVPAPKLLATLLDQLSLCVNWAEGGDVVFLANKEILHAMSRCGVYQSYHAQERAPW